MALVRESIRTLRLYAFIFYIGSGCLSLFEIVSNVRSLGYDLVWDTLYALWAVAYIGAGLYFLIHTRELIPRHRLRVIRVITAFFFLEVAYMVFLLGAVLLDPSLLYSPEEAAAPDFIYWVVGGSSVGFLFSLLIYLLMVRAVNAVSGHTRPGAKPPIWLTVAMWFIIIALVIAPIVFLSFVN